MNISEAFQKKEPKSTVSSHQQTSKSSHSASISSSHTDEVKAAPKEPEPIDEEILDIAYKNLQNKRLEWEQELNWQGGNDFLPNIRGGKWLRKHKGKEDDYIRGAAATADARQWCKLYGLQLSMSFAQDKFGIKDCTTLAVAFCHRMQYFYDLWVHQDEDFYEFTEHDAAQYMEELDFVDLQLEKHEHPDPAMEKRFKEIKALFPQKIKGLMPKAMPGPSAGASSSSTGQP